MIQAWLLAAAIASSTTALPPAPLKEAAHAIEAGRLDQARILLSNAIAQGSRGPAVDRLLADLAFASEKYAEALSRYEALAALPSADAIIVERAGIAALKTNQRDQASKWLSRAAENPAASWRVWNARGALADGERDFAAADEAYAKAQQLSPEEPELINNIGWSSVLRGDWAKAIDFLARARALLPRSTRIANNLELAQAALAAELPQRRSGEDDESWAARLNDAGVVAYRQGNKARAIAAFTRAIETRSTWYERAANNLEMAQAK